MRNSLARRISLNRPSPADIEAMERQAKAADEADDAEGAAQARADLEAAKLRARRFAYIDPVDVRYNRFDRVPKPNTQAVMFCLMDVSGSMTEAMKDLAKRFFLLLHVFLTRRYKTVDLVFIRHTSNAQEVDEDTFFHSRETGGTIVSTALEEMLRVVRQRYNPDNWNIYAAHALMSHGVHRYARRPKLNLEEEKKREEDRRRFAEETYDDIWRTAQLARESASTDKQALEKELAAIRQRLGLPEENLLYFLEKRAPRLKPWQRELARIVRHVSQYFYPQKQTKMMNEGCATFCHYEIVTRLHEKGFISDGALLEIMHSHTSVVTQPDYDDQRFSGINPYALGFAMMRDIKRICIDPSEEDRAWFPDIAGNGDPYGTLRHAWENYRDESFILQYLSPRIMREFRLFKITDDAEVDAMVVDAIHEERGYREIRRALARQYDLARHEPDIQIRDVDLEGDRCLVLSHAVHDGVLLDEAASHAVLEQLSTLWHYGIRLE
ncbi:MAG: SpoVR family protein, partial [Polyangiaceae bacterium]